MPRYRKLTKDTIKEGEEYSVCSLPHHSEVNERGESLYAANIDGVWVVICKECKHKPRSEVRRYPSKWMWSYHGDGEFFGLLQRNPSRPSGDQILRRAEKIYIAEPTDENLERLLRLQVRRGIPPIIPAGHDYFLNCYHDETVASFAFLCNHCDEICCLECSSLEEEETPVCNHGSICRDCVEICGFCASYFCPRLSHECESCGWNYCSDNCRTEHEKA